MANELLSALRGILERGGDEFGKSRMELKARVFKFDDQEACERILSAVEPARAREFSAQALST